jgi:hypothetical protein
VDLLYTALESLGRDLVKKLMKVGFFGRWKLVVKLHLSTMEKGDVSASTAADIQCRNSTLCV